MQKISGIRRRVKAAPSDALETRRDVQMLRTHFISTYEQGTLYALILTIGCNLGLRAGDLLRLTVGDVRGKTHLEITERKTGKPRRIFINGRVQGALEKHFAKYLFIDDGAALFAGRKGHVLGVKALHRIIRSGCKAIGLTGNYGSHTMRKTFARFAYEYTCDMKAVNRLLCHSTMNVTRLYVEPMGDDGEYLRSDDEVYSALNL